MSFFRIELDSCPSAKRAAITNVDMIVRGKNEVSCVSVPLTSTGDLIFRPGLSLHSEPKTALQLLIFTMKVIFETRRARKALSALERMWGRQGKEHRDLTEKNLSTRPELKHFCFLFVLS